MSNKKPAAGTRLAAAGSQPPPGLDQEELQSLTDGARYVRGSSVHEALVLESGAGMGTYLLFTSLMGRRIVLRAIGLFTMLVVLGLLTFPLVRIIARPLEKLTSTARGLAQGDLSVRTGMIRKDELGILARTLDEMADRLDRQIRSEKELLANISHEIRTPLARIRVALELCDEEQGSLETSITQLNTPNQDLPSSWSHRQIRLS